MPGARATAQQGAGINCGNCRATNLAMIPNYKLAMKKTYLFFNDAAPTKWKKISAQ